MVGVQAWNREVGCLGGRPTGGRGPTLNAAWDPVSPGHTGLVALATVFSFDPSAGSGLGKGRADSKDLARVSVSGGWMEDLKADLADRVSDEAATLVQTMLKAGPKPSHDSDIVSMLRRAK